MSRRNKPRRHGAGGSLAWPIIAFGVVLLAFAVFLFTRQGSGSGSGSGSDSGTPQIMVDQQKIDYGYVKFGEVRAIKMTVANVGDGVLRFKQKPYIEVLEGC